MLSIHKFQCGHETGFDDFPSMVGVKERLTLWDHRVVTPCRATNAQGSPSGKASRRRARKLSCIDSRTLVETSGEAGGPVACPLRHQAYRSVVIGACENKKGGCFARPPPLFCLAPDGN